MQGRALDIAIAEAVDLGLRTRPRGEGIARRHPAGVGQVHDLAEMVADVLRFLHLPALAERDEQIAVAVPDETRAEVDPRRLLRLLPEDHLDVVEPIPGRRIAGETAARDFGADAGIVAARVTPVDEPV